MAETPDFDRIAREVVALGGGSVREIAAALVEVWNARGLADVKAVKARHDTLVGQHVAETIRAQDCDG